MLQRFFSKLNESMKLATPIHKYKFWKQIPIAGSQMRYVFYFFLKIIIIIAQSGLKLYDLTVVAAGVEMNKFVISSHNGAIAIKCLFDRTEDRILP